MNWNDKDRIQRALMDASAFLIMVLLVVGLLMSMSGCKSTPATTVDNTTVTTEVTRTEYAPDGSVSAVEVHKEVVKSDVVTAVDGGKKKGGFKWKYFFIALILSGLGAAAVIIPLEHIRRKNI